MHSPRAAFGHTPVHDDQAHLTLSSTAVQYGSVCADPLTDTLEKTRNKRKLAEIIFRKSLFYKPLLLFVQALALTAWLCWYNVMGIVVEDLPGDNLVLYRVLYAVLSTLIVYPSLYCLLLKYASEGEEGLGRKLTRREQLVRQIWRRQFDLFADVVSYVCVFAWISLISNHPHSHHPIAWEWVITVLAVSFSSLMAWGVSICASNVESKAGKEVVNRIAHIITENGGWMSAVLLDASIQASIHGYGNIASLNTESCLYVWGYTALVFVACSLYLWFSGVTTVPYHYSGSPHKASQLRCLSEGLHVDLTRIVPPIEDLVSFETELVVKTSLYLAAISLQNAVYITILAPESLDDSNTEYTNGFLYYALAVTFGSAVVALVLEKIINYRVRTHSVTAPEVVLHNENAKMVTLALGMLVGYAWSGFIIRASGISDNAIASAVGLACFFTAASACASVYLAIGFEGKSENVVDILPKNIPAHIATQIHKQTLNPKSLNP